MAHRQLTVDEDLILHQDDEMIEEEDEFCAPGSDEDFEDDEEEVDGKDRDCI